MNAIEAMSTISGRRLLLIRSTMRDPESVTVSVRDSGVGIDPQKADQLFDAFFTTKPQGMGMGLSICRNIISAHGGRLSNAAGTGPGATFEFTLPAHVVRSGSVGIATA
jgi:signal transduction histidine kinase